MGTLPCFPAIFQRENLRVPSLIPGGGNLFNRKVGSIAYSFSLSLSNCPDITKVLILLKRMYICKSSIHPLKR